MDRDHGPRAQAPSRRLSGASFRRVIDPRFGDVAEHAHDWPLLSLYVMGAYRNRSALGEVVLDAPATVLYAAGAAHANRAGPDGFEQVEVQFDPAWLGRDLVLPAAPVLRRIGGAQAAAARSLALLWASPTTDETALRTATRRLLALMLHEPPVRRAPWVDPVAAQAARLAPVRVSALAARMRLHPVWLGRAYRVATGETLPQTGMRRRVEVAARLLRETAAPAAEVALAAGFCDQSHMIRGFHRVLGRTPGQVRAERACFRSLETSNPDAPAPATMPAWKPAT